ncbi:hypothetical protein C8R45DRAFT_1099021 [Mycena sanguinolenta]|nr:hypothetical protein C8R45DRAFT_1099021 [Mycena sanguinolenta]
MTTRCDIHSLPIEILSEIFRSTVAAATPKFWGTTTRVLQTELKRIANAPLLVVSQVCSRWHETAINNSSFWSTIEVHSVVGGHTPPVLERTIRLLNARLERSRDAPLLVSLLIDTPLHPHIFHLLSQHSHRWERLDVVGPPRGLETSVLRHRLPRLKKLVITSLLETAEWRSLANAPRLEILCLTAPLVQTPFVTELLRLNPPRTLDCMALLPRHFGPMRSLVFNLPATTDVELTVDIDSAACRQQYYSLESMCLLAITGSISTLLCSALEEFHPDDMSLILDHLLASLAVRQVKKLFFACRAYPRLAFEWPHLQFLALCRRSNLGRSVTELRIAEVRISQGDLLEILSVLKVLEHLEIGDTLDTLITDGSLGKMTCAPGQETLVPRLSHLAFVSRLVFTHSLIADFVMSRVARLSQSFTLLHLCIHPFPKTDAALIEAVEAVRMVLWELAASNDGFKYEIGQEYVSSVQY